MRGSEVVIAADIMVFRYTSMEYAEGLRKAMQNLRMVGSSVEIQNK
jgi:hypothetical protein